MAELFKNAYNSDFFVEFTKGLEKYITGFDSKIFMERVYVEAWNSFELKQRMRHLSTLLHEFLPGDFSKAAAIVAQLSDYYSRQSREMSLTYMLLPDYIEQYGLDDFDSSVAAMEKITTFTSCEFAVRPFILKYRERMIDQMMKWTVHEDHRVRRLTSEGCRPRLPWAMALPYLKEDPHPIMPILDKLKQDESEFVRKSVANNLNDIAKDNPGVVIGVVKKWKGQNERTDWILKHGSRTLLKQGEPETMKLFGFGSIENMEFSDFQVSTPEVRIGEELCFSFKLKNKNRVEKKIRLEYGVYYQKAKGTLSRKVYKISERLCPAGFVLDIERRQSFRLITTRKFHLGLHQVSIIVNGVELDKHDFQLIDQLV